MINIFNKNKKCIQGANRKLFLLLSRYKLRIFQWRVTKHIHLIHFNIKFKHFNIFKGIPMINPNPDNTPTPNLVYFRIKFPKKLKSKPKSIKTNELIR